jgi:Protein of unknown function (DUF3800)
LGELAFEARIEPSRNEGSDTSVKSQSEDYPAGDRILALYTGYGLSARERIRLMLLTAYVDDSGSEPSAPTFVLAGFVLPAVPQSEVIDGRKVPSWVDLSNEWETVLRLPRELEYLKMSEVWDRKKGPFANWSDTERSEKVTALAEVISKHSPESLSVSIEWEQYKAFQREYVMPKDQDSPYFFLFYRIITLMAQAGEHYDNPFPVDFVFDCQNRIGRKTREWYYLFKDYMEPQYRKYLGAEPVFKDEKKVVALQTADMLAWFLRREALAAFAPPYQQLISASLQEYLSKVEPLTVPMLRAMATSLRIGKERSRAT